MLAYLNLLLVSSGAYYDPDFSESYSSGPSSILSVQISNSSILLLTSSSSLVTSLDFNFNTVFEYSFPSVNPYTPVWLQASDLVYVLLNVLYLNYTIPAFIGNQFPVIGKVHSLLVILTYQGELVRTQWIGDCMDYDSWGLGLYVSDRIYAVEENVCSIGNINVYGTRGEPVSSVNYVNTTRIRIKGNKDQVFLQIQTQNFTDFVNFYGMSVVYSVQEHVQDYAVSENLALLMKTHISILDFNGTLIKNTLITVADLKSIEYYDPYLLISGDIFTNILDYQLQGSQGTIVLEFNSSLILQAYQGFSSVSNISFILGQSPNIILGSFHLLSLSQNPFSRSAVPSCLNITYNFLGEATCTLCKKGYILLGNHCLPDMRCPAGTIQDNYSMICSSCSSGCASCVDSSESGCLICEQSYNLYNSQCVIHCPEGTFSTSNGVCSICPSGCSSCDSNTCWACTTGYLQNGTCVKSCRAGSYPQDSICQNCSSSCDVCTNTECISCSSRSYLDSGQCIDCPKDCNICSKDECTLCVDGYALEAGACYLCDNCDVCMKGVCENCTVGYYLQNSTCVECVLGCSRCEDSNVCRECSVGWVANQTNGACEKCQGYINGTVCMECQVGCDQCSENGCEHCSSGWGLNLGKCEQCGPMCSACENNTCLECSNGVLSQGSCIENCTNGFEQVAWTCVECPENCAECSGGICDTCAVNFEDNWIYLLVNGSCYEKDCALGFLENNGTCIYETVQDYSYFQGILLAYLRFLVN